MGQASHIYVHFKKLANHSIEIDTARQPSNPQSPGRSKRRFTEITPEAPCQFHHPYLPPLNTISLPTARQPSQTLPPLQPVFSSGQYQGTRAAWQFSHSPSRQRDQRLNTGLDLPRRPQTISQGAVFSEKIQGPLDVPYVQSKTDSQLRTMSQEVCMSFADGQPDLPCGTSEFGRFLQDRLITADCEETQGQPHLAYGFGEFLQDRLMAADCEETQGQPQLAWEFGEFLQDRLMNFDCEETQGQPQLEYNEFASDFPVAQV